MKMLLQKIFTAIFCLVWLTGCEDTPPQPPPPPPPNLLIGNTFSCSLDEGCLISDDIYITNKAGIDAHDVSVTLSVAGEEVKEKKHHFHIPQWRVGERKHFSLSILDGETVTRIQRITMELTAKEGHRYCSWITY